MPNIKPLSRYLGWTFLAIGITATLLYFTKGSRVDIDDYSYVSHEGKMITDNAVNNMSFDIEDGAFTVYDRLRRAEKAKFTLSQILINEENVKLDASPSYTSEDNVLTETHSEVLQLNYTNNKKGLRQDFVIQEGPTKDVEIVVDLDLNTVLEPQQLDPYSIELVDHNNVANNMQYRDLLVYDANGRFLDAEMTFQYVDEDEYRVRLYASADEVTYPITVDPLSTSDSGYESMIDSTRTGFAVAGDIDVNGDGFCDAVVSSHGWEEDMVKFIGKFDVFYGSATGVDLSMGADFTVIGDTIINKMGFNSISIGSQFGFSLDNAGDVNGDGVDDLIVGAPTTSMIDTMVSTDLDTLSAVGAFYIYYGGASFGTSIDTFYGEVDTASLGYSVAGLGDYTGNGFSDVAVSAPGSPDANGMGINVGAVYIYEGSPLGLNAIPVATYYGTENEELYGTALAGPGDIDGNGSTELLIGAPNYTMGSDTAIGRAHMYRGEDFGMAVAPWEQTGAHKNAKFGQAVSGAGNFVPVSGNIDVLIGSSNYNPEFTADTVSGYGTGNGKGAVYVFAGNGAGLSNMPATVILNDVGVSGFGSAVAYAGDVDNDNLDDIIVGAPSYGSSTGNEGAVYAYYGKNYEANIDTTFDWCITGEKNNAFLGNSIDLIGGCANDGPYSSVIVGAYGYSETTPSLQGAAFSYQGTDCGLIKYTEPQFLTFPEDTIFADAAMGLCGANVRFDYPEIGTNCENPTLSITTGIDSSGFFPIGESTVNFRIESNGEMRDSSFVVVVEDTQSPTLVTCPSTISIEISGEDTQGQIAFALPEFTDNDDCTGIPLTITKEQGVAIGSMQDIGVYPFVYSATDAAGNVAYCTFRVVIRKLDQDGKDCTEQEIIANQDLFNSYFPNGRVEFPYSWNSNGAFNNSSFGTKLILSMFESISGVTIPKFVKAALGELSGINLAFVNVDFNFLPTLRVKVGMYYDLSEDTALNAKVNYLGQVCSFKPKDTFYGCRDEINFATSFILDEQSSSLSVHPGSIKQEIGAFAEDFVFEWPIFISVRACIGVPYCIPFGGCGCAGYRASWQTPSFHVFDPIDILPNRVTLPLIAACDEAFEEGASIFTAIQCMGGNTAPASDFIKRLIQALPVSPEGIPFVDPFFYDKDRDEFNFFPNKLLFIGNKIPEMEISFGRLTRESMGPSYINGNSLVQEGRQNRFFNARLDVFSLLSYIIPPNIKESLICKGIDVGTETLNIGNPKPLSTPMPPALCEIPFYRTFIKIDVMDINFNIRSDLKTKYTFDPTIEVEGMEFRNSDVTETPLDMAWERPSQGTSGFGSSLSNVSLDENIKLTIPDGLTDAFYVDNTFSANGRFTGNNSRAQNLDLDLKILEFRPSIIIPTGIDPVFTTPPFTLFTFPRSTIRSYNNNIALDNFNARVSMQPDNLPPVTVCRDTTLIFDEFGNAFLGDPALYLDASSYDLPIGGTGTVIPVDVYPDTIYCDSYPSTPAYLVTRDDNCNFDTCQFLVTLQDINPPQLGCVDITVGIGENGTYVMDPDEVIIGSVDNCTEINPIVTPSVLTCDDVGTAVEVSIVVADIAGNMDSCTVNVTVVDTFPLLLECPYLLAYPVTRSTSEFSCTYTADEEEFRPTLVAPDCSTVITYELTGATEGLGNSNVAGVAFNLGETTVTYTATDASGNSTSCSFIVIVEDTVQPIIACPSDVTISTNEDAMDDYNCTTDHSWNHPNPSDNCSVIAYEVEYSYPDGSTEVEDLKDLYDAGTLFTSKVFDLGTTRMRYTAVDTMNNASSCTYTVTVIDDESPMLFCNEILSTTSFTFSNDAVIAPNTESTATISVANSLIIDDISISRLAGTQADMSELSMTLTSPAGTTISLFDGLCAGNSDFDMALNDDATDNINTAPCSPLGNGNSYSPAEALSAFDGEDAQGDWILTMTHTGTGACGVLNEWAIQIVGNSNEADTNVIRLIADAGACSYTIADTAFDPRFTDNCDGTTIMHSGTAGPFTNTLNGYTLPMGETPITWVATDPAGNTDTCELLFVVLDDVAPVFINCPKPDVVENAEFGECGAYANLSLPIAEDNCGPVTVVQVDNTGLSVGSVFPIGTTLLIYEATDESGNTSRCSVRVIINDTQPGSFACPSDINVSNDNGLCGAVVTGLTPTNVQDNCPDNTSIIYQVEYPTGSGEIVASGVQDASGEVFETGSSTVTYTMYSQPQLLITEVSQEIDALIGGMDPVPYTVLTSNDYMEITNVGPAAYNVSGLVIERFGDGFLDYLALPNMTIIEAGETLVVHYGNGEDIPADHFFNMPCATDVMTDTPVGYAISYKGRAIDVVATNGYDPVGQLTEAIITTNDWSGSVATADQSAGIIRTYTYDNNTAADWVNAEDCHPINIGELNPTLNVYPSNGAVMALQSIAPDAQSCSFVVVVEDTEAPRCMEESTQSGYGSTSLLAEYGECNHSIINVPIADACTIQDINVAIEGSITLAEEVSIYLISPQQDTLLMYDQLCTAAADMNFTFDDESSQIANDLCGSWSGSVRPQSGMLMTFYGMQSAGDWTLWIDIAEGSTAQVDLTSWNLNITCMDTWEMADVEIENDTTVCNAEYTWIHPFFFDNCTDGTISVNYYSDDPALIVPDGGTLLDNFGKGGYEVTATFPVGTTTVEYTLVDSAGNQSQCSFDVTVLDTEKPVITYCPNNILVALETGECQEVVNYEIEAMDNCEIASIVYTPESGSYFQIGSTTVTVIVTDLAGNTSVCEFDVIVDELVPTSNQLICNTNLNMSLDQNCEATLNADQILEGNGYGCFDDYCLEIETQDGEPHANFFDATDINQTFNVTLIDCNGDSTNSCWGTVTIEEKFAPEIQCPDNVVISCNVDPELRDTFGVLLTGEAYLLNCEPGATIVYEDFTVDLGECAMPRREISRTWIATDADGNQASCVQQITIEAVDLLDIEFPEDYEMEHAFACYDVLEDPTLTHPDSTGHPTLNGLLVAESGSLCGVSINMEDNIYTICPGSYEILRTWRIRNLCQPISDDNPVKHTQIIQVLDKASPELVGCPENMIVSADPWGCQAAVELPLPHDIDDHCSEIVFDAEVLGGGLLTITGTLDSNNLKVYASNLRLGVHTIVYHTEDECGNKAQCSFDITVVDDAPPVPITLQNVVVSITSGSSDDIGYGKLNVSSIDNGSYDGCTDVKVEIRRDTDPCGFEGNTTFNNNGDVNDGIDDIDDGQYVQFCCSDLYNTDLDVDGDGVQDVGYVKVWIRVWDDANGDGTPGTEGDLFNEVWSYVKVEDKLNPVITCPDDITLTCADDIYNLDLTGQAYAYGSCGPAEVEYEDISNNLNTCGDGVLIRRWRIVGSSDAFCNQRITLESLEDPVTVSFSQVGDKNLTGCPDEISIGEPTWVGGPCEMISYTLKTDTLLVEDGACYSLINTFTVINWCDYKPESPSWVETEDFTDGYAVHVQHITVTDDTKPVIANCSDQYFPINGHQNSDGDNTLCEAQITLFNSATDSGSDNCPTGWLKWQVFVDLWGDGTDDLEYSSFLPSSDNQLNDSNGNGIPDQYLSPTANGEEVAITLPDIEGNYSSHKVRWKVTDGCGNVDNCEYVFEVEDKKAPTPYCINLSTAAMEADGTVDLWAIDFNPFPYDNCTDVDKLRHTFTEVAPEDDPLFDPELRSSSRTFNCEDVLNSPVEIQAYVWDERGNSNFCVVYLTITDEFGTCGEGANIAGRITTENGDPLLGAEVQLNTDIPEYPRSIMTNEEGRYSFLGTPYDRDYNIQSLKDDDYRNGVSTLDLVLIQRHILDFQELDSPYKVIAADINGNESVSSSDVVQLRKLVLGLIDDLPTNTSWRFVDAEQTFADIHDPWPIKEELDLNNVQADALSNNFIAVKVGDVNDDVEFNLTQGTESTTRSASNIEFVIAEQQVHKGEMISVSFKAGADMSLHGYQLSMELDGLSYVSIEGQSIAMNENFVGRIKSDLLTMSYHRPTVLDIEADSDLFTMKFVAKRSGRLSEMIDLSSRITTNEAYIGKDLSIAKVKLRSDVNAYQPMTNQLYQNEPNPFTDNTTIGFDLVQDAPATLTIQDVTGASIRTISIEGKRGYNSIVIDHNMLSGSGLYYYQIDCDGYSATKKMILVR